MQEFAQHTRLKEQPGKKLTDQEMIHHLLEDHEAIIRVIRVDAQACLDKYADLGTNNFLLTLLEKQEKLAWMLRAGLVK
jgi:starvation-inducible DNA-binding protein